MAKALQKKVNAKGKSVLLISDLHAPYQHPDALRFLEAIKEEYAPDIVVNVGDEVDGHSISYHETETSLFNPDKELEEATKFLQKLHDIYPEQMFCTSNHGSLLFRKIRTAGIPLTTLKTLNELYGVGNGWSWHHEILLDTRQGQTLVVHGRTGSYGKLAKEQGCNAVQGHFHGKFELTFHQSSTLLRYNMLVGCLIDHASLAFAYGVNHLPRPIHGVGFIYRCGTPTLIRMNLKSNGRWDERL